jgi:gamma-glutamylcyclotransferase (GGCT)/AIG2-like uncharacterized protein YtfP
MEAGLRVFVYGSLKPGEINDWVYAGSTLEAQTAIAYGQLYALPLGYPAMTSGKSLVYGYLLSFASLDILPILDQFEQHDLEALKRCAPEQSFEQSQYERRLIEVFKQNRSRLGFAWAYTMTTEQVSQLGGIRLTCGNWNSAKQRSAFSGR